MTATIPTYTMTNESITIVHEGSCYSVQKDAPNYANLRQAIIDERWEDVPNHLTVAKTVAAWAQGRFAADGNQLMFDGQPVPEGLNQRIFALVSAGQSPEAYLRFWERLQANPSFRSMQQLFPFLSQVGIPLTPDGCFLAYKSVRSDFTDHHTGKFVNRPGQVNEMPRNQISDDPNQACDPGFHVGALSYAKDFGAGSRVIICKVDPADVVSVPYDCSQQKIRVCKYEVIGHHNGADELPGTVVTPPDEEECFNGDGDLIEDGEDESAKRRTEEPTETGKVVDLMAKDADEGLMPVESKRRSKRGFAKLDAMDVAGLLEQSIATLRRYAGKGLLIVGASKIPGGKSALINRILQVRE